MIRIISAPLNFEYPIYMYSTAITIASASIGTPRAPLRLGNLPIPPTISIWRGETLLVKVKQTSLGQSDTKH